MDWRKKIDVGPIYSQGMCSGCWAFTTAQVVGDSKAIATGSRMAVSPYHLLSCDNLDSACNTGNMATAYAWINVQPKGVLVATDFPEGSSCEVVKSEQSRGVKIDGYCEIPPLEGQSTLINLMRALQQQTVAVGVNIKPLQLYGGGIVRLHDCPPADSDPLLAINHAAVLVGWGYDQQVETRVLDHEELVRLGLGRRWICQALHGARRRRVRHVRFVHGAKLSADGW